MKRIRAVLGYIIHHSAHVAAILSAEVVRDDLKLLDRVLIGEEDLRPRDRIVIVRLPIDLEIIRAPALSVGREARAVGVGKIIHVGRNDPGYDQRGVIETAIYGQRLKLLAVENRLALSGIRIQQLRGARLDLNRLCSRSRGERPACQCWPYCR